jgi:hypothetical protein
MRPHFLPLEQARKAATIYPEYSLQSGPIKRWDKGYKQFGYKGLDVESYNDIRDAQ